MPTLSQREQLPAVSAALDQGRAGLLRMAGEGGDSLLAYETEAFVDQTQPEIGLQPLALSSTSWIPCCQPSKRPLPSHLLPREVSRDPGVVGHPRIGLA